MHDIDDAKPPMGNSVLSLPLLFGLAEALLRRSSNVGSEGYIRSIVSGSVLPNG